MKLSKLGLFILFTLHIDHIVHCISPSYSFITTNLDISHATLNTKIASQMPLSFFNKYIIFFICLIYSLLDMMEMQTNSTKGSRVFTL